MSEFIPLSVPNLKGNELKYVTDAIETEWVSTGGGYINKFEEKLAEYVGMPAAVACQSGTAGLHLALMGCGVQRDDEVIVPTLTFIAAVNPVKYIGAEPVFMDCGKDLCMDPKKLRTFCQDECELTEKGLINKKTNRTIKALLVVHVFGNIANLEEIMEIAKEYKLKVVEDATEALGSYYISGLYEGKFAGTIGDFGVYSFNGNKIITTGGGGMIVAKNQADLAKAKYLSTQAKDDQLNFIHNEIGYNYRMTNVQAALGLAQLEQLESFIETKKRNYELYKELLANVEGVELLEFSAGRRPNYWFYALSTEGLQGETTASVIEKLHKANIQSRPIWGLIHEQLPYKDTQSYEIEQAIKYHEHIVNIPCSSNLTEEQVKVVVKQLKEICERGK